MVLLIERLSWQGTMAIDRSDSGAHLFKGNRELLLDGFTNGLKRDRLCLVQAFLELCDIFCWEQGWRGGHKLTQLDVCGSQSLKELSKNHMWRIQLPCSRIVLCYG